jgi:hypothetical protein
MMGRHVWLRLNPSMGHRNVGTICTPNAADSPRRLHKVHSPRKHQDLHMCLDVYVCISSLRDSSFKVVTSGTFKKFPDRN